MSLNEEYELLSRIELFEELNPVQLKRLIFVSRRYQIEPDEYLFKQGDEMSRVFAVVSGELSVLLDSPSGEIHVAMNSTGDLVGEIAAISGAARTASIRANTYSEVIGFERDQFVDTVTSDPPTALRLMQLLSTRLTHQNNQLRKLVQKGVVI